MHMAQLMPLPLTVSCSCKIQIGFTILVPAHPGSPRQHTYTHLTALFSFGPRHRAVKWVNVCECVCNRSPHRIARPMSAAARPMSALDRRATPNIYQQMTDSSKRITKVSLFFHRCFTLKNAIDVIWPTHGGTTCKQTQSHRYVYNSKMAARK